VVSNAYKCLDFLRLVNLSDWNIKHITYTCEFNNKFELTEIGSLINRNRNLIKVDNVQSYKRITIRMNCGGVYVRDVEKGEKIKTKSQYVVSSGQLIISKIDARNGAFGIIPKEADDAIITGNFWAYDVDEKKVDISYLLFVLSSKSFIEKWFVCSNGSGNRLYLQEKLFLSTKVPLPPLDIQHQIVNKYNIIIMHAMQNEAHIKMLESSIDKVLFDELEVEKATEEELISHQSHLHFAHFSKIEKWGFDKNTTGFIYRFNKYQPVTLTTYSQMYQEIFRGKSPKYDNSSKTIMLNQKCNRWNSIDLQHAKTVNENWIKNVDDKLFTKFNDIIINSTGEGTIGRASLIQKEEHQNLLIDSHMLLLRLNVKVISPLYYIFLFNSSLGQYQVNTLKGAQATKQTELGIENLKRIMIPLPPLEIQRKIAEKLISVKQDIENYHQKATQLREQAKLEFEEAVFGE